MSLEHGADDYGTYYVTDHSYALSTSHVAYFDYDAAPGNLVSHFLRLVQQN